MRKTLWIVVILVGALSAYAIWPVVGFYRIVAAVESRNAAALTQLVDFRPLRKSLTKQLLATYLELTGKEKKLGLLGKSIAMGIGSSIVEPIVARLVNEETLMDLLTKGSAAGAAKVPADLVPFSETALRSGWQTWWNSEYGLGDFYVSLPPEKSPDEQFKVKLKLALWQWKLSGIELPDQLRVQLVQEILKKQEKRGEVLWDQTLSMWLSG
jgi:hypothetical protein